MLSNNLTRTILLLLAAPLLLWRCAATRNYNPQHKYSPAELQEDYRVFQQVLEEMHPSLYWYTSKDSMDYYFEQGRQKLKDSLPEYKFRYVLSYVLAQVRCGHTSVRASKGATYYSNNHRSLQLPLAVKLWPDTAAILGKLRPQDSMLTRGSMVTSIEGRPISQIVDSMFRHLSGDGYNLTHKYQTLSNSGIFRAVYGAMFGLDSVMRIGVTDSLGVSREYKIHILPQKRDTVKRAEPPPQPRITRRERKQRELLSMRTFAIDSATGAGMMELNTFSKGNKLRKFFRQSFREMDRKGTRDLVLDLRGNGGGSVGLSNLLTGYLASERFTIADSLYAISKHSKYDHLISNSFVNKLFFTFMTRREDGRYHFRYFEHRSFKTHKDHHFQGQVYILIGGNTFSAASLVAHTLGPQDNILLVGEETGGGAYGNTAWLIPDVTLPNSKVRFRLPLFRLVIDRNLPKGRGIMPEIPAPTTMEGIKSNKDTRMELVKDLIRNSRG